MKTTPPHPFNSKSPCSNQKLVSHIVFQKHGDIHHTELSDHQTYIRSIIQTSDSYIYMYIFFFFFFLEAAHPFYVRHSAKHYDSRSNKNDEIPALMAFQSSLQFWETMRTKEISFCPFYRNVLLCLRKNYKGYPEYPYLLYEHIVKQCFVLLTSKHISKEYAPVNNILGNNITIYL